MAKNRFTRPFNLPSRDELERLVPNLNYRKLDVTELPIEIRSNLLTEKFNSVVAAASGSTEAIVFSIIGIRPDHNEIDEHPFVFHFDSTDQTRNFGGIIHHGGWTDRTTPMEPWQEDAISTSGITASFTYKGIPHGSSGSLYDLADNGMLEGFKKQADILFKNKPNGDEPK